MEDVNGDEQIVCDICGNTFRTPKEIRDHNTKHHYTPPEFPCDKCEFQS